MDSFALTDVSKIVGVGPDFIDLEITDPRKYEELPERLRIGSFVEIFDDPSHGARLVSVVKQFRVRDHVPNDTDGMETTSPKFVVTLQPIGRLEDGKFSRGGKEISIPPKFVEIASEKILQKIYSSETTGTALSFGALTQDADVRVNIDGDRFFGKHIGVVVSTGSGKSSTVAAVLQKGIEHTEKQKDSGLKNNSHIIIFDLHGEYHSAFPKARLLGVKDLILPYWLMNSEELEEMFIESSEHNSHNQVSQFRSAVIQNKAKHNPNVAPENLSYDDPLYFSLEEVINYLWNLNAEMVGKDPGEQGRPKLKDNMVVESRSDVYFSGRQEFAEQSNTKGNKVIKGPFAGEFDRFLMRLETKTSDQRLQFLLNSKDTDGKLLTTKDTSKIIANLIGYGENSVNVTIFDLSGIPFEVLSTVVSLVVRVVFTFCFKYKKLGLGSQGELPYLLVLEEAHNYISRLEGAKYNSVRKSVERVAKEGRKYGVSLMIVSQRPSEISETVFSQCSNFVAMRLTNPNDQGYINRLLPDDISGITDSISSLGQREAVLIGDSLPIPTLITVDTISDLPTSSDIDFYREWKKDWMDSVVESVVDFR